MPHCNVKIALGTNVIKTKFELKLFAYQTSSTGKGELNSFLADPSKSIIYFSQGQGLSCNIYCIWRCD